MPVFNLATEKPLPTKKRSELAMMFTHLHCENTDAPRTFVNVLFAQGSPIKHGYKLAVHAAVRAGRTKELNAKIEGLMVERCASILGMSPREVQFQLAEIQASWIMEGGVVLPEVGEEEAWLEDNAWAADDAVTTTDNHMRKAQ